MATVESGTSSIAPATGTQVATEMASMFASSLPAMNTPEALGWALVTYVLAEGVSQGTINGDKIEVPCLVTVSIPPPTQGESDLVSELCITVLGHQLTCIQLHSHATSH
jgi:hypothetical protein